MGNIAKKFALLLSVVMCSFTYCFANIDNGYNIYPIPHKQYTTTEKVSLTKNITIVAEKGIDLVTINRAKQILTEHNFTCNISDKKSNENSNILLGIDNSNGAADKEASTLKLDRTVFSIDKFDRHLISISKGRNKKGQIVIIGENTDAVFCALASIEQILDEAKNSLQCVQIYDYADIKERGIIEGYYGVPYSAQVTKDLFRFMARYKMNTYMYGAKSDPYHSRYWSDPYPITITEQEEKIGYLNQRMMKDIAQTATDNKINFVWAIHPGKAFADPKQTDIIDRIMSKFESMYDLGIRQFGVFVDDVGVPSEREIMDLCATNLTTLQERIDKKWNGAESTAEQRVKPINYVPQLYAFSWVARSKGEEFFNSLSNVPEKVNIYITGRNVWSVPNNEDINIVRGWLGRNVSWWWNYVCNDQDVTKIFVGDMYTNFSDESHIITTNRVQRNLTGLNTLILNPMQQGELSKIGLFSVADYSWNNSAFNNELSWENAIKQILGSQWANDFRIIAPHLRYYDDDAIGYLITRYKQSVERKRPAPEALIGELEKVNKACKNLLGMKESTKESDRLFYSDLRPWLLKLCAMSSEALSLLKGELTLPIDYANNDDFKFEILGGMGESISLAIRTAELSNTSLLPFIYWLRENK